MDDVLHGFEVMVNLAFQFIRSLLRGFVLHFKVPESPIRNPLLQAVGNVAVGAPNVVNGECACG